ncbi:general amidase [Amylocystis lapponica]|nr:general amidase [Amylocystis lapponica]
MVQNWKELVADKRRRQQELIPKEWLISVPPESVFDVTTIPKECGLLSEKELLITETVGVDVLLKKLATAEWSAVEVTTAFCKRATVAQQLVNCLTEIFFDRALARATELDAHLKATGQTVGPLHGLPISLKDQLCIKGLETTIGYVSWIGNYAGRNAALVDILEECGAVLYVRTNVPQTLMWGETFNNIFGRTSNPHNRTLTCGGSSGGEGALIGLKGSPLGVGSDVGGSIRIPSLFNGLYALRPSTGRVPYAGCTNSMEGQDSELSVLGPMSNSLSGVKTFMQSVLSKRPWLHDPIAVRKAWDTEAYTLSEHGGGKELCFGIIWNDGVVTPSPPILRALEMTKAALLAAGHKVVDWHPYKHAELCQCLADIWEAGAKEDFEATTAHTGEPLIDTMSLVEGGSPSGVRTGSKAGVSAYQLWQIQKQRLILRQEYLDNLQKSVELTGTGRPLDALIAAGAPFPAPPHGKVWTFKYTSVWNALDYSTCVFPVTKVDPAVDVKKAPHDFLSEADHYNYDFYDPETFRNAPVGLQLVGRSLEEEAVIAMTEIVDAALKSA